MDVVIEKGTQFVLPAGHTIDVNAEASTITLHTGGGGGTYELRAVREADDEVIYIVGSELAASAVGGQPMGYPFVPIQDEMARMQREWEAAGGDPTASNAWADGETHNAFLTRRRAELRALGR